eukprot:TRINITY_DN2379_c0_g1_i1.p2 TRINITY_DN2379_c0_g1~~TRINITY_DN2379_c0_g1_i1.p2  ORF type:complete len:116 (-),score=30.27 TRINITY_DN2379_c0_g1_i1:271-618(-)
MGLFDIIGGAVLAPAALILSAVSLNVLKTVLAKLSEVANGATELNQPFDAALPLVKSLHMLLNERLFEKGVRTDFGSVLAMAAVIGLIAIGSALSARTEAEATRPVQISNRRKVQ